MCYERRRAEACVDESAHHALVNAGMCATRDDEPVWVLVLHRASSLVYGTYIFHMLVPFPRWLCRSTPSLIGSPSRHRGSFENPGHGLPGQNPRTETGRATLPGQDHMYPFGIIGVAPRYIPAGAVIELAGIRLGCTSTPTGIWKKHRRGESNSRSLIPWPQVTHLSVKSHSGIAPDPSLWGPMKAPRGD